MAARVGMLMILAPLLVAAWSPAVGMAKITAAPAVAPLSLQMMARNPPKNPPKTAAKRVAPKAAAKTQAAAPAGGIAALFQPKVVSPKKPLAKKAPAKKAPAKKAPAKKVLAKKAPAKKAAVPAKNAGALKTWAPAWKVALDGTSTTKATARPAPRKTAATKPAATKPVVAKPVARRSEPAWSLKNGYVASSSSNTKPALRPAPAARPARRPATATAPRVESELEYRKRMAGDRTFATSRDVAAPAPKITYVAEMNGLNKAPKGTSPGGAGLPLLLGAGALVLAVVASQVFAAPPPPPPPSNDGPLFAVALATLTIGGAGALFLGGSESAASTPTTSAGVRSWYDSGKRLSGDDVVAGKVVPTADAKAATPA